MLSLMRSSTFPDNDDSLTPFNLGCSSQMFFAHMVPNLQNLLNMCKGSASRFTETGLWKQHADRIYRARFAELPSASKGTSMLHLI